MCIVFSTFSRNVNKTSMYFLTTVTRVWKSQITECQEQGPVCQTSCPDYRCVRPLSMYCLCVTSVQRDVVVLNTFMVKSKLYSGR